MGWLAKWNTALQLYELYTPAELHQPVGFRTSEAELSTREQAISFINHY